MFVKYEKKPVKTGIGKKIGFDKRGRIVFYKVTVADLKTPFFVVLLFDPETNRIGIKPVKREDDTFFQVKGSKTKFIQAKRFFNHFDIHPEGRFDYTVEDGMLVVQLPEASDGVD